MERDDRGLDSGAPIGEHEGSRATSPLTTLASLWLVFALLLVLFARPAFNALASDEGWIGRLLVPAAEANVRLSERLGLADAEEIGGVVIDALGEGPRLDPPGSGSDSPRSSARI